MIVKKVLCERKSTREMNYLPYRHNVGRKRNADCAACRLGQPSFVMSLFLFVAVIAAVSE